MAADDIYRLTINYEAPSGYASTGLYYIEDSPRTAALNDTDAVNDSFQNANQSELRGVLSSDWKMPSSEVHKVFGDPVPKSQKNFGNPTGTSPGPSLPANNAAVMQLTQITFKRSSNGRMYFPGLAEGATDTGVLTAAFLTGAFATLAQSLSNTLNEIGGSGSWIPIVISAKIRDQVPGVKDWPSAVGSVISFDPNPIIARQVRRATQVRGKS